MDSDETPPPINVPPLIIQPEPEPPSVPRWRWCVHLLVLTVFPVMFGVLGYLQRNDRTTAVLPKSVGGLLVLSATELGIFFVLFGIAWLFSRASATDLLLKWRCGVGPIWRGLAYSIGLRVIIGVVLVIFVVIWAAITGMQASDLKNLRPKTEELLDASALTDSPLYFILTLTLISFVVAGLREELWRIGMLAGLKAVFPEGFATLWGKLTAIAVVGFIFGLGHAVQGVGGMALTGFLGIGLGVIMVWHKSIWDAVMAHGFFDATTFLFLFLIAKYSPGILQNL